MSLYPVSSRAAVSVPDDGEDPAGGLMVAVRLSDLVSPLRGGRPRDARRACWWDQRIRVGVGLLSCGHVAALPQVVGAQRGPVADQPQVAERVDEAALPVDPPWRLVVTDLVDAAVGSGRHGAIDEAVRVIDEHLDPDRPRANSGRGVPAVVLGLAEEERGTGKVSPTTPPRFHSSVAPSASEYHRAAAAASGTASITEITGG